jgi:hypothetical protein
MALQTSGAISLNNIANEFGGSAPHALNEYYGVDSGIPSSGQISIGNFYGASGASITYTGYIEKFITPSQNNGTYTAAMPSSGATATRIIAAVWHDNPSYTSTLSAASGWTRIVSNARGRPYMAVFIKNGSASGTQTICTGQSSKGVNIAIATFTHSGLFYHNLYWDGTNSGLNQWHSGNACWNGLGPAASNLTGVEEYYMVFFASARPINGTVSTSTSGNTGTLLSPGGGSRAVAFISNKLYGANGDPGDWNFCMNFSNRGSYAFLMLAVK